MLYEDEKYKYINLLKSDDIGNANCTKNLKWSIECGFEKVKVVSVKYILTLWTFEHWTFCTFWEQSKNWRYYQSLFIVKGAAWYIRKNG